MVSRVFRSLIVVLSGCFLISSSFASDEAPDCHTIDECLVILLSYELPPEPAPGQRLSSGINTRPIQKATDRLAQYGDAAAGPLVSLLRDHRHHVRNRAAHTLFGFHTLDVKYLPQLIEAHRADVHWLEIPIALTGAEEALVFLQQEFLKNPVHSSNTQVFFALKRFGDRNKKFVMGHLKQFIGSQDHELLSGLVILLNGLPGIPPEAAEILLEIYHFASADEIVQRVAMDELIRMKHPFALGHLIKELDALHDQSAAIGMSNSKIVDEEGNTIQRLDFDAYLLMSDFSQFGVQGRRAGPSVSKFLHRPDLPDSRAEAAYVIGNIGYHSAIGELLSLEDELPRDWLLAYNTVESLGRLRAHRAKRFLRRTASEYWYRPVRNNAERALNFLSNGKFERPGVELDVEEPNYLFPPYRYQGDEDQTEDYWCGPLGEPLEVKRFYPAVLQWPSDLARNITWTVPTEQDQLRFEANFPEAAKLVPLRFAIKIGDETFIGTNRGEWGGDVFWMDPNGVQIPIIGHNAQAALNLGNRLLLTSGLAHLGWNSGQLWTVDATELGIERSDQVRLPSTPGEMIVLPNKLIVVRTHNGDVVVDVNGTPKDFRPLGTCDRQAESVTVGRH